jgi:ferric-dicitrate binding protein FerR (iron transport regulator)
MVPRFSQYAFEGGGQNIWVPDGDRAEIQTNDGYYVRLDGNTSLDILRIDGKFYQFYLAKGHVYVNCRNLSRGSLQIDNPLSSVRVYEGSIFMVDVSDDGYTNVSVLKGSLIVEGRGGTRRVYARKTLS